MTSAIAQTPSTASLHPSQSIATPRTIRRTRSQAATLEKSFNTKGSMPRRTRAPPHPQGWSFGPVLPGRAARGGGHARLRPHTAMIVQKRHLDGFTLLNVEGVIKLGESAQFFAQTLERTLSDDRGHVIIDFSKINFIDSTGIGE